MGEVEVVDFGVLVLDVLGQLLVELALGVHDFFAVSIGTGDFLELGDEVDGVLVHARLTVVSTVFAFSYEEVFVVLKLL